MKRIVFSILLACSALAGDAFAQAVLNDAPSRVVGQPAVGFSSTNPNVVEGREFLNPAAVVVDRSSTPQALFVSDLGNNRVLGWRNAATFANGAPADIVIGQVDKVSTQPLGPGTARPTGLSSPGALAVDSNGNLYVADTGNNRILRFSKPFASEEDPKVPNMVIGQPNFSSGTGNQPGLSERTLFFSTASAVARTGLAFDAQGNLWASDPLNHRLLRYPVAALTAGTSQPAADLVLGQPNFTTNTAPGQNQAARLNKGVLSTPSGVAVDSLGNVFVADGLSRAVVYTPSFFNGKEASRLLGVAILEAGQAFTNQLNVASAEGVFLAGDRPGIADPTLHRILVFDALREWPAETEAQPSPPARIVIGQADFTSNRRNRDAAEASASSLNAPVSAFFSGTELFVADSGNHRVLVFPQVASNAAATRVLGQLNFTFSAPNLVEGGELFLFNGVGSTANLAGEFSDGAGIAIDSRSTPRLYIADTFNNRVLGYLDARRVRPGDKADIVIGQSDFNRVLINAPQNNPDSQTDQGLFRPSGIAVDRLTGDLFVADSGNGRVLRFSSPFERRPPAGERYRANLVLGQSSAFSRVIDPSSRNMAYPFGLAFTTEGHLLVSDAVHNRVLFFRRPAGGDFTTGMAAEKVIAQPDFLTGTRGTGQNRLSSPRGIAIDTDDRLYVADAGNNRLAIYDRITTASNDPAVAFSLGGLDRPQGVYISNIGEVWVADTRRSRISRFPRFELLPITTAAEQNLAAAVPLAVTQDASGNLYVAEATNRIAIFYNGLAYQIAASFADRALSPGGIGILYPRSSRRPFSSETRSFNELPNPVPLPKELADTQVLLNDRPVPLYFVAPGQINFLVPMSAPDSGRADVQVLRPSTGEILAASSVELARVSPALFIQGTGAPDQGQIAALNQDNSVNNAANPATKGQIIQLFGAGQGFVPNAPADGEVPSGEVRTQEVPRVLIGTDFVPDSAIQYSGLAPGLVGVWQINVTIPENVAGGVGPVPVVVQLRSVPSNVGFGGKRLVTTIAVRP
jgi:uncharacterized protein (TIGR03437 family)